MGCLARIWIELLIGCILYLAVFFTQDFELPVQIAILLWIGGWVGHLRNPKLIDELLEPAERAPRRPDPAERTFLNLSNRESQKSTVEISSGQKTTATRRGLEGPFSVDESDAL